MKIQEIPYGQGLAALLAAASGERYVFLLESSRSSGGLGKYSIFGYNPERVISARGGRVRVEREGRIEEKQGNGWDELARHHRERSRPPEDHPFPFLSGAVGFCTYESGLAWERIVPAAAPDHDLPELWFGFYDTVVVADEEARRMWIVSDPEQPSESSRLAEAMAARVAGWRQRSVPTTPRLAAAGVPPRSNFPLQSYREALARIRAYIAAGDVYQVNLAQRFAAPLPPDGPLGVFQRLRQRSAAPFAAYLDIHDGVLVGSSPERFVRLRGDTVSTRPIKGTRPRGSTPVEDERLRRELLASEKDRAELLMIVDLERNDLGRVCRPGSVEVSDLNHLEEHPTLFHLVAEVKGRLRPGLDIFDVLRASFPGGSITGAPKVRAMQIINELEPHRRGVYTGAMGYLGFRGTAELNIAIRTVQCSNDTAYFHAGSGVVWDSDADAEYAETLTKALAMSEAVTGRPAGGAA